MPKSKAPEAVRVTPVPGLNFDPVDASPDEAAALVASGSFMYADTPPKPEAVTAEDNKEAENG